MLAGELLFPANTFSVSACLSYTLFYRRIIIQPNRIHPKQGALISITTDNSRAGIYCGVCTDSGEI